ncbi:MAG: ATP-binding cassette domain-containing protein [Thermoanaerobaculia bacterium]|nr:ATP-binding cassette domain-containing protein [Thermoanaerobaculia bacterium]
MGNRRWCGCCSVCSAPARGRSPGPPAAATGPATCRSSRPSTGDFRCGSRRWCCRGRLGRRASWAPPSGEDREAAARALSRLGLEELRGAYLTELSGGELKRALVARALVGEPELLVLDEPTASLDEPSRRRLWELVEELPAATTVLLVTHDLAPETFRAGRAVLVDRRVESLALGELHRLPLLCGHRHG